MVYVHVSLSFPFKAPQIKLLKYLPKSLLPTDEIMTEVLEHQHELDKWFVDIKKWGMEDCCDTRRVCLDVLGVPPHGWKWENFKSIAELWGRLIYLGKSTLNTDSFEVMRVLVATKTFQRIEAEVLLSVGYGGYKVTVKEAETVSQVLSPAVEVQRMKCQTMISRGLKTLMIISATMRLRMKQG